MTSSQEEFIVESTPVVDLKASGLVQTSENRIEPRLSEATPGAPALSNWDSEKTEVLADADADAVAWLADETGQKFVIAKFPFFLGRSNECDVVLNGKGVSRKHAEIVFQSGRLVVNDLESLNGLKVNGYKVARVILEDNDEIRLGDVVLRFHTAASSAKEKAASKPKVEEVKKPEKAAKSVKTAAPTTTAAAAPKNVVRYIAMLSVMAGVIGLVYVTANLYSKRRHVEEAILPDPSAQSQVVATEAAPVAPDANSSEPSPTTPVDQPAVASVNPAPEVVNRLAPPPPPTDSGAALPPPAPFAPPAFSNNESVASAPAKAQPKAKKPEPIKVDRAELYPAPETTVVPTVKRPAVEDKPIAVVSAAESKQVLGAQLVVSQADDRYMRGEAPALLKELASIEASSALPAEERGRISRKLNAIQSLYSFYAEGKDAYAKGDKERAFSTWSTFLAKERSAYPGKRSVYAAGVADTVSSEYVQQADAATRSGKQHEAYKLLEKASANGSTSAKAKLDAINVQAQNLYRDALRQEYVNSTKARELWQKVVDMVPEDNEYSVKASGKLAYYSRWGQ